MVVRDARPTVEIADVWRRWRYRVRVWMVGVVWVVWVVSRGCVVKVREAVKRVVRLQLLRIKMFLVVVVGVVLSFVETAVLLAMGVLMVVLLVVVLGFVMRIVMRVVLGLLVAVVLDVKGAV